MIEMTIDDTIAYIDGKISELISKMINARTKHIDAINQILTKIQSIQSQANLSYRQGRTYDLMAKVENGVNQQFDIEKPRFQLSYTGGKMPMSYDSGTIEVPSVPFFVYEMPKIPNTIHELTLETLRKAVLIFFPADVNVVEEPDIENSFGKYYVPQLLAHVPLSGEITTISGKTIAFLEAYLTVDKHTHEEYYLLQKMLHIDGVKYAWTVNMMFGKLHYDINYYAGGTISDQVADAILISFATNFDGNVFYRVFNKSFDKGELIADKYFKFIVIMDFGGSIRMEGL